MFKSNQTVLAPAKSISTHSTPTNSALAACLEWSPQMRPVKPMKQIEQSPSALGAFLSRARRILVALAPVALCIGYQVSAAQPQKALCKGPLSISWHECVGSHVFFWGGRYEGEWKSGKMHGRGREYSANGTLLREGTWAEGAFVEKVDKEPETVPRGTITEAPKPVPDPRTPKSSPAAPITQKEAVGFTPGTRPGQVDTASCLKLNIPDHIVAKGRIGITSLSYVLDENGEIPSASVLLASGTTPEHATYDQIFLEALMACKGAPAAVLGKPVKSFGRADFNWVIPGVRLDSEPCRLSPTGDFAQPANVSGITQLAIKLGANGGFDYAQLISPSGNTLEHAQLDREAWRAVYSCPNVQVALLQGIPSGGTVRVEFRWAHGALSPVIRRPPILDVSACEKPEYTTAAKRAETIGDVTIIYSMNEQGVVTDASVERSSGPTREHKQLDRASLEAVKSCRGVPGVQDGTITSMSGRITYNWRLTGSGFDLRSLIMLPLMLLKR